MLEAAVEQKLEDQAEFVRWWDEKVTPNKGGDRRKGEKRGAALFVSEAEDLTGITQQQVSKWRRRLQEPEKYRAMLYGAAYAKAMAEKGGRGKTSTEMLSFRQRISDARAVLKYSRELAEAVMSRRANGQWAMRCGTRTKRKVDAGRKVPHVASIVGCLINALRTRGRYSAIPANSPKPSCGALAFHVLGELTGYYRDFVFADF